MSMAWAFATPLAWRHLQVDHVSVMNWVKAYASQLPEAPVPDESYTVEMDELYTFIGKKKPELPLDLC